MIQNMYDTFVWQAGGGWIELRSKVTLQCIFWQASIKFLASVKFEGKVQL